MATRAEIREIKKVMDGRNQSYFTYEIEVIIYNVY